MNSYNRTLQWLVWGVLGGVILVIFGAFIWTTWLRPPMILPVYGQLGDFTLTNQVARKISLADLKGSIWLADVIFTRCPGPCALMTRRMKEIQAESPRDGSVQFVSLTADPEFDTPETLRKHSVKFGADAANWQFLTGPKARLYDFAIKDLKFTVIDNGPEDAKSMEDRFLHSTQFVLVDRAARVRGYFDGADAATPKKILQAIRTLLREKSA